MKNKSRIGLALGGGASRGIAHIGVLQVLEEHNIFPDYIAGSSIGAIVGGLYAAGISPKMMEGIAKNLDIKLFYDVVVPRKGFVQGKKLEELFRILTQDKSFDQLNIPLAVTAVDLKKCRRVILNSGKVYKAIRASISLPGIFTPVYYKDQVLVDGALLERVPVNVVRQMGADVVIGVDVAFKGEHHEAGNILEVIFQSIEVMEMEIFKMQVTDNELMICPETNNINPMVFDQIDECIQLGREAALKMVDKIAKVLQSSA